MHGCYKMAMVSTCFYGCGIGFYNFTAKTFVNEIGFSRGKFPYSFSNIKIIFKTPCQNPLNTETDQKSPLLFIVAIAALVGLILWSLYLAVKNSNNGRSKTDGLRYCFSYRRMLIF